MTDRKVEERLVVHQLVDRLTSSVCGTPMVVGD